MMNHHQVPVIPTRHDRVRHFAQSPLYKFAKIRIRQDPAISPLFAPEEVLAKMPTTYLVVSGQMEWDICNIPSITFLSSHSQ